MFPLIVPPPETIEKVPPAGDAVNVFVSPSVIWAFEVVLSAVSHCGTEQARTFWKSAVVKLAIWE